jgi:hypothetical protein
VWIAAVTPSFLGPALGVQPGVAICGEKPHLTQSIPADQVRVRPKPPTPFLLREADPDPGFGHEAGNSVTESSAWFATQSGQGSWKTGRCTGVYKVPADVVVERGRVAIVGVPPSFLTTSGIDVNAAECLSSVCERCNGRFSHNHVLLHASAARTNGTD